MTQTREEKRGRHGSFSGRRHGGHRGPGGAAMMVEKPQSIRRSLTFLWKYLQHRKSLLALAFAMVLLNTGASLAGTNYLQPIIDNFLDPATAAAGAAARLSGLARGVAVLSCIYLVSVVASYLQSRLMVRVSQTTINQVRRDLFNHLQGLSVRYFDSRTTGDVMSRFTNDVDTLNEALQNGLTTLFSSSITVAGIFGLMLWRSPLLTVLALCSVPLTLLATKNVMKLSRNYFQEQQRCLGEVNGYIEEIMSGQKVVKTFCYEDRARQEFYRRNEALKTAAQTAQGYAGMMMPLARNINNVAYAVIAAVGGLLTIFGSMTVGSLVVFLQLVQSFGRPLNELSNQYNAVVTALAGTERICDVMEQRPETEEEKRRASEPETVREGGLYSLASDGRGQFFWQNATERRPVRGDVRFDQVAFGYDKNKRILDGISLFAKPGQKIAFVGSTGAGKTTIINLLTGFYEIDSGSITIDGIDISRIRREELRNAMSVVLQDTHLFTGSIRDNIRYGRPEATDSEVEQAARLASADGFIRRLPQGYDTIIEGDGGNLSQGQRQLLNIARAALADAPILILDEATSSVDTRTERHIERGLDRLMEGRTTFVIAHRLSTVRNSQAILVMEQGRIIERGTHEDLLALKGRYYQLSTGAVELD